MNRSSQSSYRFPRSRRHPSMEPSADLIAPPRSSARWRRQRRKIREVWEDLRKDESQSKTQTLIEQKQVLLSRSDARLYANASGPPKSSTPEGLSDGSIRKRQQLRRKRLRARERPLQRRVTLEEANPYRAKAGASARRWRPALRKPNCSVEVRHATEVAPEVPPLTKKGFERYANLSGLELKQIYLPGWVLEPRLCWNGGGFTPQGKIRRVRIRWGPNNPTGYVKSRCNRP